MARPIEQHVYLVPQRDAGGNVSWTWLYNGGFGSAANFPKVEANHGKNDIYFTIADPMNQIKFAGYQSFDVNQAIWLSEKGSSTAKQPGIHVDQRDFDGASLGNGGLQVKLGDANGRVKDFVYQLNFVNSANGNQAVTSIDPEIRNGDGGQGMSDAAVYAIVAALTAATLTLLFVRFGLGWQKVSPVSNPVASEVR